MVRATRLRDNAPVLIKMLRQRHPARSEAARLRREYEIGAALDAAGALRYYALEPCSNGFALVYEDVGGESLAELLHREQLGLDRFLKLAVSLARALDQIHRRGVIHKDIKPQNVVIAPDGQTTRFIDFGISTRIARESAAVDAPGRLEGTLAYMSPEQTGRMNRQIDYRTDFYSLGATYYEMLTGAPPFRTDDALEMVHNHIARPPASPAHSANGAQVPPSVQRIVLKLLAKTAEERYLSAAGLIADLDRCLDELSASGAISEFAPGAHDFSDAFQLPQKLYGREREIDRLFGVFGKITQGERRLMLIAGHSGVGKSALINEIHKPIAKSGGVFVAGKFDQFKRDVPFSALIQALSEWVRSALTENEARIKQWRDRLVESFGMNGQALIDLIPELELIVGEQAPLPELSPTESQNRFFHVFRSFIRALARADHPLVLFLDDLQWADRATLALLKALLTDPDSGHLLIFGAYRDNEVNEVHPLAHLLEELRNMQAPVESLTLAPLRLSDAGRLIQDAFYKKAGAAEDLTQFVFQKTEGNPFFIGELLKNLCESELIRFDQDRREWTWDMAEIQARGMSGDVVALLVEKLGRFSDDVRYLLKLAACMGARFNLRLFSLALADAPANVIRRLSAPIAEGLLIPGDSSYKYAATDPESAAQLSLRFAHDRVQQAAYALLREDERMELHLRIGRTYLDGLSHEERDERIIEIANHLDVGRDLEDDAQRRIELAEWNFAAGRKAKHATAYDEALRFFGIALDLLPANALEIRYELYIQTNLELGQTYYLLNDLPRADRHFEVVLKKARTGLEKLSVYESRIAISTGQNRPEEAVNAGLEAAEALGVKLSRRAGDAVSEILRMRKRIGGRSPESLLNIPPMKDESALAAMKLLMQISLPAFLLSSPLYPRIIARLIELTLDKGLAPPSAFAFCAFGALLAGELDDPTGGATFGRLALDLTEKMNARELRCRSLYLYAAAISHWTSHVSQKEEHLQQAFQSGLDVGDLVYASQCLHLLNATPLWTGYRKLSTTSRSFEKYYNALFKCGQRHALELNNIAWQYLLNLQGDSKSKWRLVGQKFNEEETLQQWRQSGNANGLFYLYFTKASLAALFGSYGHALEFADLAIRYQGAAAGSLAVQMLVFYRALALLGLAAEERSDAKRKHYLDQQAGHYEKLRVWAERSPANFKHLLELIEAEQARVSHDHGLAMDRYDRAIAAARSGGFTLFEGLANELAARYYRSLRKNRFAALYLEDARAAYLACRASARANDIELANQELIRALEAGEWNEETAPRPALETEQGSMTLTAHATAMTVTSSGSSSALDTHTVLKAAAAIAGELHLPELLKSMMRIVMENAGAQRGALVLEKDGRLLVEAEGEITRQEAAVMLSTPLEEAKHLPASIIHYAARTRQPVVLHDAANEGAYREDPCVAENQTRSALARPIILQGKLIGVLYLENNSAPGAFSPERQDALNILSGQIASALENARLYSNLEAALEQERLARSAERELNRAATLFVPTELLSTLGLKSIADVTLGQNIQREMTVLFSDIRAFTALSEQMTPEENFRFINSYLSRVGPAIRQHRGFIDKYIGDAVMALFETADDALGGAIAMQKSLADYNDQRARAGYRPVETGIGLNTGELMLGMIGEATRVQGTVISDAVNLASRLESLTKVYGAPIIVSGAAYERLKTPPAVQFRLLDRVQVKGKKAPAILYEALSAGLRDADAKLATLTEFEQAVQLYTEQRFRDASEAFATVLDRNPHDLASAMYRDRCDKLARSGVPADWKGVVVMRNK